MPKRVLYTCAWCGGYIYNGEKSRVRSGNLGRVEHYHYDNGLDCLSEEENAVQIMRDMDADIEQLELDLVAERGID